MQQTKDDIKKLESFWTGVSLLLLWVFFINLACIFIFLIYNKELTSIEKIQSGFKNLAFLAFGLSVFISYTLQLPTVLGNLYFKSINMK